MEEFNLWGTEGPGCRKRLDNSGANGLFSDFQESSVKVKPRVTVQAWICLSKFIVIGSLLSGHHDWHLGRTMSWKSGHDWRFRWVKQSVKAHQLCRLHCVLQKSADITLVLTFSADQKHESRPTRIKAIKHSSDTHNRIAIRHINISQYLN